jgi:hypothetical protein
MYNLVNIDNQIRNIDNITEMNNTFIQEIKSYLNLNYIEIDNIIIDIKDQAKKVIDETVKLTNLPILFSRRRFEEKFNNMMKDINNKLERKINMIVDNFSYKNDPYYNTIKDNLKKKFQTIKGCERII